jgi:hypothetical protein
MSRAIGTQTWRPEPKRKKTSQATFKASYKKSSANKSSRKKLYRGQGR